MPFPPLVSLKERERRAEVEGDGGGRETQKEKTREDGAQQRSVLVCANQHTHSGCALPHTHRGKTRQDMGMVTHTHMGMDETTGHDTQGGEREGRRQGVAQAKTLTTTQKKKKKGKKTMTKPKDNEER